MDVQEVVREVLQSKLLQVRQEPSLAQGNIGNPLPVLLNDQSGLVLCLLGSDGFLVLLSCLHLKVRHGESFHHELRVRLNEVS